MKQLNRFSKILKVIGIALICVSVIFWLYALANTGAPWTAVRSALNNISVSTNAVDRLTFDDSYFSALSISSSNRDKDIQNRVEQVRPLFARWFGSLEKNEEAQKQAVIDQTLVYLDKNVDAQGFIDGLARLETLKESQELRTIFEYINSFGAAPKKGKLAKLQPASQEPFFQEFYQTFSEEHGEEAGSWYEFMRTVKAMLENEVSQGASIRDVKAWMNESFSYESYIQWLPQVKNQEQAESEALFSESLGAMYEKKLQGEQIDFGSFLHNTAEEIRRWYPDQNLGGESDLEVAVASVLPDLIEDESFDGSYGAIAEAIQKNGAAGTSSVSEWESSYLTKYVTDEADKRSTIGIVSTFWMIISKYAYGFITGLLLLVLSLALKKLVSRVLINQRHVEGNDENSDILLRVDHLKQYFKSGNSVTKAVDDVSFYIKKGEVFGLVGESGCGKTTTGRTIINLYDPTEGDVYFDGLRISSTQNGLPVLKAQLRQDYGTQIAAAQKRGERAEAARLKKELHKKLRKAEDNALESAVEKSKCIEFYREKRQAELKKAYDEDMKTLTGAQAEARTLRYRTESKVAAKDNVMTRMQMIFQDPIASINPRMTVREIIAEGLIIRGVTDKEYINQKVYEMLELVGLVREHADRYPHEFSGGQRQRIGIARAIIMEPDLIIADEPISALDVSIQAQVINLLNDLRQRMGLTIMFIAHNLSVVKYFSDRIAVMYFGHIVEMAPSDELFAHPLHPYTKSLLSAIPYPDPHYEKTRKRIEYNPAKAHDYSKDQPQFREIVPGHFIHCNEEEFQRYLQEMKK